MGKLGPKETQGLPTRRAPFPRENKAPGPAASPGCRRLQAAGWGPAPRGWRRPTADGGLRGARGQRRRAQRRATCCGGRGRAGPCVPGRRLALLWGSQRPRPLPAPGAAANGLARGGAQGACPPPPPGSRAELPGGAHCGPRPWAAPARLPFVPRYRPPCGAPGIRNNPTSRILCVCLNPNVDRPGPEQPWP